MASRWLPESASLETAVDKLSGFPQRRSVSALAPCLAGVFVSCLAHSLVPRELPNGPIEPPKRTRGIRGEQVCSDRFDNLDDCGPAYAGKSRGAGVTASNSTRLRVSLAKACAICEGHWRRLGRSLSVALHGQRQIDLVKLSLIRPDVAMRALRTYHAALVGGRTDGIVTGVNGR